MTDMSVSPVNTGVTQEATLQVSFGGYSSAGCKQQNEDAFAAYAPSGSAKVLKGAAACIADGASCSENAQLASQMSVTTFLDDYYSTPDSWAVKTAIARVLSSLNNWLYHQGQQVSYRHDSLVTTFSGIICKSTTAHIFHVGDSRVYRLRNGVIEQLTTDHSHLQKGKKTFLTRALGIDSHLEVDYQQHDMLLGDLFVMTTDGLHDFLTLKAAASILNDSTLDLEQKAEALVKAALQNGSDDNLTCLCVCIDQLPNEDLDEAHRKLTQLTIPPVLDVGMKIDGYEVLNVLHSGTRSHVYMVKKIDSLQQYVLKAPSQNFAEDPLYLEGFIREQWVGRRLNHNGVMKIYPRDDNSQFLYHLCEPVEGQSLRQWMFDNPKPSLTEVRDIVQKIVQAMRVFQRAGMVHRDLKPENIMLNAHKQVKIIDFGTVLVDGLEEIGSMINDNTPVGSVNYIAPEYVLGARGQAQSDLFSLGVITYEMLTGKQPFDLHNAHRRLPTHLHQWQYRSLRALRKDLPAWVDLTLEKATAPNLRDRYLALSEFVSDLTVPNESMVKKFASAPLLDRNPTAFWKGVSVVLLVLLILQTLIYHS